MRRKVEVEKEIYILLGGVEGLRALAKCFYDIMKKLPEAENIRKMHPENLESTSENLALFLSGWLGGPPLYKEKFGSMNLTEIHSFLDINSEERDTWLKCMEKALDDLSIEDNLKSYLLQRLWTPADTIRRFCQQQKELPNFQSSNLKKFITFKGD